jgi:hypothetical protein
LLGFIKTILFLATEYRAHAIDILELPYPKAVAKHIGLSATRQEALSSRVLLIMQHGTISGAAFGGRKFTGHHGFRGAPSNRSLEDRLQREPPALGNIPWGEYALQASPSRDHPAQVPPETGAMSGRQKSSDSGHQCTNTQQRPVSEN